MSATNCGRAWCTDCVPVGDNGQPTHTSRAVAVTVPEGSDGGVRPIGAPIPLLDAEVYHDEFYAEPLLWIGATRTDELALNGEQTDHLIDQLAAFLDGLRALRAHLPAKEAK
jgi:hypothetical protein